MSNRDIISIGGSSGATAPLKAILATFPADLPASVFIVLHIPSRSTAMLAALASAARALPVREADRRGQADRILTAPGPDPSGGRAGLPIG